MFFLYAKFIVRHSYLFIFTLIIILTALTIIPLICHSLPTFSDPIIGFETRGTTLAHRFIAWENLIDETRPSRLLAVNPKDIEDQIRMNNTYHNISKLSKINLNKKHHRVKNRFKKKLNNTGVIKTISYSPEISTRTEHVHWGFGKNNTYEDEDAVLRKDHTKNQWKTLKEMRRNPEMVNSHNHAAGVCGAPVIDYAHLVVSSTEGKSMLTFDNVKKLCNMQSFLVDVGEDNYFDLCQRSHLEEFCCPLWSVPNYVALIVGKTSCENITKNDVKKTVQILRKCAGYFHNFSLMTSCDLNRCQVPKYCSQYDAVYNLLFYIIDSNAFSPPSFNNTFVKNVMIFLPLPSSSTVLPYYMKLQRSNLTFDTLFIPAVDFGLKNTLFDLWIVNDTWLIGMGGLFVFICVLVYTKSFLLTLLLFSAIAYSLGVAYFLYVYVFRLEFFPFMNLLVLVVVIGIGADDAFLYVKVWKMISKQLIKDNIVNDNALTDITNISSAGETILVQIIEETLKHSVVAIFVTTLTTAVAFYASYISYIPAINCFSIFAGTAVLVNFLLMISWLPVSVFIIDVKMCNIKWIKLSIISQTINRFGGYIKTVLNRFIVTCIVRLNIILVFVLGAIGVGSIFVVFYYPGLQLPDSKQFQLFQTSHPFEQYDIEFRDKFLFEKFGRDIGTGTKMPLRWVWGIKAIDNGNHMDPFSKGKLVFDEDFSISKPSSQLWLSNFCARIKSQQFYQHTLGPMLPNCFIESFKMFMTRRCVDNIAKINRTPCCETSHFPYPEELFNLCIIRAITSLYETPRELLMPGVAGPKFLRNAYPPTVSVIVIEFESITPYSMSYTAMNDFFIQVDNWTMHELKNAPPGMKNGWFVSDFQFYDLQRTLANGTVLALLLSAALGFIVLIPSTFSFILSICALIAIIFSTTVTIAILVLSGWKLNVLESVAISTSAGLAVDFSLHYVLSYTNACGNKLARIKYALTASSGPTAAAALTTGCAGIFLLWSNLLPYSQIGTFLALIMSVSWIYATFFLCSLLKIVGKNSFKEPQTEERKSVSRISSICSGVPNLESHELEHLADSNRTNVTHSHSPSSISAMTVILHDEFENSLNKIEKNTNMVLDND